jgi:hypothetical protein
MPVASHYCFWHHSTAPQLPRCPAGRVYAYSEQCGTCLPLLVALAWPDRQVKYRVGHSLVGEREVAAHSSFSGQHSSYHCCFAFFPLFNYARVLCSVRVVFDRIIQYAWTEHPAPKCTSNQSEMGSATYIYCLARGKTSKRA